MHKEIIILLSITTFLLATTLEKGHAAYEKGAFLKARNYYLKALKSGENPALVHINLGNCAFQLQKLSDAATHYRLSVEYAPNFFRARYNLAMTCYLLEDLPEALLLSLKALKMEPTNSALRLLIASIYREFENQSDAIFLLEQAIESGDTTTEMPPLLADLFYEIGANEEALYWFQKAINDSSAHETSFLTLALLQEKMGDTIQAELTYRRAIVRFDSPISHYRLIDLMLRQNSILSALNLAEESLERYPKETAIALLIAESTMKKQWYNSAQKFYLTAFQNGDNRALPGLQNLILIFRSLGDEKSAQHIEETILHTP